MAQLGVWMCVGADQDRSLQGLQRLPGTREDESSTCVTSCKAFWLGKKASTDFGSTETACFHKVVVVLLEILLFVNEEGVTTGEIPSSACYFCPSAQKTCLLSGCERRLRLVHSRALCSRGSSREAF